MLNLRPDTTDGMTFKEVVIQNDYRLPDRMDGMRVLDIGAHIGCFALACLIRGAKHVLCYESDKGNFDTCESSWLGDWGGDALDLVHGAVWRSDVRELQVRVGHHHSMEKNHAAGGAFVKNPTVPVRTIALDAIIAREGPFDLLKIDAEGSEYPILLTSKLLINIPVIIGEWHSIAYDRAHAFGLGEWSPYRLRDHLTELGYHCEFVQQRDYPHQGMFWATKQ